MIHDAAVNPCEVQICPRDERYDEHIRLFQGCPTVAVSHGGRIFLGWYSGGTQEPHIDNYNLLVFSDDGGKSWSKPLVVIPSSRERLVHALDIQLWTAPDGRLFVFWVQNNVREEAGELVFDDHLHAQWFVTCDDPDAPQPVFSQPRYMDVGFLRCRPTVLEDGTWLLFNYDQQHDRYGYDLSRDGGHTFERHYGAQKLPTSFDEAMAYQKKSGEIRMLARCHAGRAAESSSFDGGESWTQARLSDIVHADTRLFVGRTPSGRILAVVNGHETRRCNMTLMLSEDEGETWKYKRCIDTRDDISYPDVDFLGGDICLTYDRERTGAREILFARLCEENIMDASREIELQVVSRP